jgi:hypothetical protein
VQKIPAGVLARLLLTPNPPLMGRCKTAESGGEQPSVPRTANGKDAPMAVIPGRDLESQQRAFELLRWLQQQCVRWA